MTAFMGVDVGSASARAGLFAADGRCLGAASAALEQHRAAPGHVSQSSAQIWEAVCRAAREAGRSAGLSPDAVAGIGFDATCSMAVSDLDGTPVGVDPGEPDEWDVIMWMDHRATREAQAINATGHEALRQVGGRISPEMQPPKLLWLDRHHPEAWRRARHFADLPDWLTWRATGSRARSLCSVVCKWMHRGDHWDGSFYDAIGLGALVDEGFVRLGADVRAPGTRIGGLTAQAASELGLVAGTPVATSLIDAYAGALGTMRCSAGTGGARMALIAGTSACHITLSDAPAFVPGVWGPYPGVLLPGLSANEAGQSAAGAFLDTLLERRNTTERDALWQAVGALPADAAASLHVLPDVLGNRSPLADPGATGAIVGFGTEAGPDAQAREALAAVQSLAYGTRQIIAALGENGVPVDTIVVSGGLAASDPYLAAHADATGCRVLVPERDEPVLLGTAMLGAAASGRSNGLAEAMAAMSGPAREISPGPNRTYHDRKYRAFLRLQAAERELRDLMEDAS